MHAHFKIPQGNSLLIYVHLYAKEDLVFMPNILNTCIYFNVLYFS